MEALPSDDARSVDLGCDSQPVETRAATDALDLADPSDLGQERGQWITAGNAEARLHERLEPDPVVHRITGSRQSLQHLQCHLAQPLAAEFLADLANRQLRRETGH